MEELINDVNTLDNSNLNNRSDSFNFTPHHIVKIFDQSIVLRTSEIIHDWKLSIIQTAVLFCNGALNATFLFCWRQMNFKDKLIYADKIKKSTLIQG